MDFSVFGVFRLRARGSFSEKCENLDFCTFCTLDISEKNALKPGGGFVVGWRILPSEFWTCRSRRNRGLNWPTTFVILYRAVGVSENMFTTHHFSACSLRSSSMDECLNFPLSRNYTWSRVLAAGRWSSPCFRGQPANQPVETAVETHLSHELLKVTVVKYCKI